MSGRGRDWLLQTVIADYLSGVKSPWQMLRVDVGHETARRIEAFHDVAGQELTFLVIAAVNGYINSQLDARARELFERRLNEIYGRDPN
jgi:hypothetical protein